MKLAARIATRFSFSGKSRNHSGRAASPFVSRGSEGSGARSLRAFISALALAVTALAAIVSPAAAATPTASTGPISDISYTSAKVSGDVGPTAPGGDIYYFFQYSTDGINWANGPEAFTRTIPAESAATPVSETLTGLNGGTEYFIRLAVNDGVEETYSPEPHPSFTTLAVEPPKVLSIDPASEIGYLTATVSGKVERPGNPDPAFDAECRFEYVSDADYQARNEVQQITVEASAGSYTLSLFGESTSPILFDASPSALQAALEGLPAVGPGAVTVSGGPGDEVGEHPYTVTFAGPLAEKDIEGISADYGSLVGEGPYSEVRAGLGLSAFVVTTTIADGHPEEQFARAVPAPCDPEVVKAPSVETVVDANLSGLTQNTTYHLRLVAKNAGGNASLESTFKTLLAQPPAVSLESVVPADTSAEVNWEVNPEGTPTDTYTEYSLNGKRWYPSPGYFVVLCDEVPSCYGINPLDAGTGTSPKSFTLTIPDLPSFFGEGTSLPPQQLEPNTNYFFRVVARNAGGKTVVPSTFKTAAVPPTVQTLDASPQGTSAELAGRINPGNSAVEYQFEWGPVDGPADASYEHSTPAPPALLSASDNSFHTVSDELTGLQETTEYHYRIVATNAETGVVRTGAERTFLTRGKDNPPASCPNQSSRVGASANLPDCRAFELVTPDLNNIYSEGSGSASALADGSAIKFYTQDAPDNADGSFISNWVVSRRGPGGWASQSLAPAEPEPVEAFAAAGTDGAVSADFREATVYSSRPLVGGGPGGEVNIYIRKADGSYVRVSARGPHLSPSAQQFDGYTQNRTYASPDFKHLFIRMESGVERQLDEDPVLFRNTYEWFDGKLRLISYLPDGSLSTVPVGLPAGLLGPLSDDGENVIFSPMEGTPAPPIYLREGGLRTVEASASERSPVDPNPEVGPVFIGIAANGSEVVFTSKNELTNEANTGETDGVPNDLGNDIYSYDVDTEVLTDLTVADDPADAMNGAAVQRVVAITPDASYIYFVALGNLAEGAVSGQANLYVEHDGEISFVSPANKSGNGYVTPNGQHFAFASSGSLTAYDNAGKSEVYKYTYGRNAVECVSCRPSGEPPTGSAAFQGRAISIDGERVFFSSTDAVVPQATNGLSNVYEYVNGEPHLLTPGDAAEPSRLFDASASGDDVFIAGYQELAAGAGSVFAIYDARVNAEVAQPDQPICQDEGCRGAPTSGFAPSSSGSAAFKAPGEIVVAKSLKAYAKAIKLRVNTPESGRVTVSGKGLKTLRKKVAQAGSTTLTVRLRHGALKVRAAKGVFKTKAQIVFEPQVGSPESRTLRATTSLTFMGSSGKGGK